jgi:hypothetical protein
MVWNRNFYAIAFPCLMILGTAGTLLTIDPSTSRFNYRFAVSGYGAIAQFFLPNPFTATGVNWATGMLVVSMATNIVVTSLTAGRIWSVAILY